MNVQDLYVFRDGSQYVELFKKLHHIADPSTLVGVFGPNPDFIAQEDAAPEIDNNLPITAGSFLLRSSDGTIYLVTSNKKFPIADPAAKYHYQFNGVVFPQHANGQLLADLAANAIPTGRTIKI